SSRDDQSIGAAAQHSVVHLVDERARRKRGGMLHIHVRKDAHLLCPEMGAQTQQVVSDPLNDALVRDARAGQYIDADEIRASGKRCTMPRTKGRGIDAPKKSCDMKPPEDRLVEQIYLVSGAKAPETTQA